jgi:hypothetical protein
MSRAHTVVPYPLEGGCQSITTSGTSARTSNGVGAQTRYILVKCVDADAHYVLGDSSCTATTSDTHIGAGDVQFIRIIPGQYVAAIQSASAGTVYVSEFAG